MSENEKSSETKVQVFFDGACPVCDREMKHYKKQTGASAVDWIDIANPQFCAQSFGLDAKSVHQKMHVRKNDGTVLQGVDGFIAIWESLPRYIWAAKIAQVFWIKPFLNAGYSIFAKVRPVLFGTALKPKK